MHSAADEEALFKDLDEQSRGVFKRLTDGHKYGVAQQEETITEILLLELAKAQPNVKIRTFTRHVESRETGADWEWWWEGEKKWFGALVQAKRLKTVPAGFGYDFSYRPKASRSRPYPVAQIDLLQQAARQRDLPALFALYNGPDFEMDERLWPCRELSFSLEAMGVSVLSAATAAWLSALGSSGQEAVNRFSKPLPCTLCPSNCADFPPFGLPRLLTRPEVLGFPSATEPDDLAYLAARSVLTLTMAGPLLPWVWPGAMVELAAAHVRNGVRDTPPSYLYSAMETNDTREVYEFDDIDPNNEQPARVVVMTRDSTKQG